MTEHVRPKYAMYLAVIPFYRQHCIDDLKGRLGESLLLLAGEQHTDRTVSTGISTKQYTAVHNRFFIKRKVFIQTGHWKDAYNAETAVLDLNPRNLSTWILTLARRSRKRRTLLWGHLYPRSGPESKTSWLRRLLRSLSDGTILYGYSSVAAARHDLPNLPVWVAPNALYPEQMLGPSTESTERTRLIYVGRLVPEKKVDLLIRGHAVSRASKQGSILTIVGSGSLQPALEMLATELKCRDSVEFTGTIIEIVGLKELYSAAFQAVSPGYAGLSLTQSLGFGVPMLVAENEPHAPEIELARFGGVTYFASDDEDELARAIDAAWLMRDQLDAEMTSEPVRSLYSAEAMADGLLHALSGINSMAESDGWIV